MLKENMITVVIPSIPPRAALLQRAIASVMSQTYPAAALSIAIDHRREGAARTRQRALEAVQTPWVAFLDDDDEFLGNHLETLITAANDTGADYVYSWFKVVMGGTILEYDPVFPPTHYTEPWNNASPRQTTVTTMVRTGIARAVGFAPPGDGEVDGLRAGEDWDFTLGCMAHGALIHHVVDKTWLWHHDSSNTSGLPTRW